MLELLKFFYFLKRKHPDHDKVDDINTRFICGFALAIGFLLFSSEYGINSIQCFQKGHWKKQWKGYVNDLCFIEGSYFVDTNANLPHWSELPDKSRKVSFYQWTPFFYLIIAIMFHLPRIFWTAVNSTSYLYLRQICETATAHRNDDHKEFIERFYEVAVMKRPPSHSCFGWIIRIWDEEIASRYLIVSYFLVKIWNIANVVIAHLLICLLIDDDKFDDPWGYKTFMNIVFYGIDWKTSGAFPRLTTCDVGIRQYDIGRFDKIKHEQVQCFLASNNYIEKIFLVTWAIFVTLFVVNVWNLLGWMWKLWFSRSYIIKMVERCLEKKNNKFEKRVDEYVNLLIPDAKFTFFMIAARAGDMVSGMAITDGFKVYDECQEQEEKQKTQK